MKAVGVKPIDETFKVAITPLREGTDLRDNVQVAFAGFKEACGLAPISNIKQCIRLLSTRIANSGDHATLNYVMRGEVSPIFVVVLFNMLQVNNPFCRHRNQGSHC